MSLESKIEELNNSIAALTEAMNNAVAKAEPEDKPEAESEKPKAPSKKAAVKKKAAERKATKGEPEDQPEVEVGDDEGEAVEALTYDDLAKVIVELASKDRGKAVEILGEFGAKKGKDIAEDQWPEAHAKFSAALEAANA